MTDIVMRLRQRDECDRIVILDHHDRPLRYGLAKSLEHEAADEIERLRAERDRLASSCGHCGELERAFARLHEAEAERDRLRDALRIYASPSNWSVDGTFLAPSTQSEYRPACGDIARAALGESDVNIS